MAAEADMAIISVRISAAGRSALDHIATTEGFDRSGAVRALLSDAVASYQQRGPGPIMQKVKAAREATL